MRIVGIDAQVVFVNHRGNWVFVEVRTDSGLIGVGEASQGGDDQLLVSILAQMAGRLVGEDPQLIGRIGQKLRRPDGGRVYHTALSGIEQALWDIMGQHLGVPIRTLFGGEIRDRIRLYANINRMVTDRSPEGFAAAAGEAVASGFTAIKLAPFDELASPYWDPTDELASPTHVRTGRNAAWRPGLERVAAVRHAVGDQVEIAVDCHGRMEPSEATLVARALGDLDLLWYEEPAPCWDVENLRTITEAVPMPTAAGEFLFGVEQFKPFLTSRVVDIIMPDVKHDGGLLETKMIAEAARMNQLLVSPHNPAGPVATVASGQVMSTVVNFLILEYPFQEVAWREELLEPREHIEEGHLILSDRPGLGHSLNRKLLEEHRVEV